MYEAEAWGQWISSQFVQMAAGTGQLRLSHISDFNICCISVLKQYDQPIVANRYGKTMQTANIYTGGDCRGSYAV